MEKRLNVSSLYDILITDDFSKLRKEISNIRNYNKICIVSDNEVFDIYGDQVIDLFSNDSQNKVVVNFVFKSGEKSKTLDTVKELYSFLIENNFDRNDLLLALGGGVVGDLTGYTAATYLRGIDFVQIPTSLLAQVDSSVGGKTGVDFDSYKNMVGAFYQPKLVYINITTLNTLSERQFVSGLAEVLKYGYIMDKEFYCWLIENKDNIFSQNTDALNYMIYKSCDSKRIVVEKDPYEKSLRATLNLGHTLGHAVEKQMDFKLLHGECVAIGIAYAAKLSAKFNLITKEEAKKVEDILEDFKLPVRIPQECDMNKILLDISHDKKMDNKEIRFILLEELGKAIIKTIKIEDVLI